jgi:hypothetical protein
MTKGAGARALKQFSLAALPEIRRGMAWRRRLSQENIPWVAASAIRTEGETTLRAFHSGPFKAGKPKTQTCCFCTTASFRRCGFP